MGISGFVFIYTKAAWDKQGNACIMWKIELVDVCLILMCECCMDQKAQIAEPSRKGSDQSGRGASLVDIKKQDYSFEEETPPLQYPFPWHGWFTTERRERSRKSGGPTQACGKGGGLITAVQRVLAKTGRLVKEGTTCRTVCRAAPPGRCWGWPGAESTFWPPAEVSGANFVDSNFLLGKC